MPSPPRWWTGKGVTERGARASGGAAGESSLPSRLRIRPSSPWELVSRSPTPSLASWLRRSVRSCRQRRSVQRKGGGCGFSHVVPVGRRCLGILCDPCRTRSTPSTAPSRQPPPTARHPEPQPSPHGGGTSFSEKYGVQGTSFVTVCVTVGVCVSRWVQGSSTTQDFKACVCV